MKLLFTLLLLSISIGYINCFLDNIDNDSSFSINGNGDSKYIVSKYYSYLDKKCTEPILNSYIVNNICSNSMSVECSISENKLTATYWENSNCTGKSSISSIQTNVCMIHGGPVEISCIDELDLPIKDAVISFFSPQCKDYKTTFTQIVTQATNVCFNDGDCNKIYTCTNNDIVIKSFHSNSTCSGESVTTNETIEKCINQPDGHSNTIICV